MRHSNQFSGYHVFFFFQKSSVSILIFVTEYFKNVSNCMNEIEVVGLGAFFALLQCTRHTDEACADMRF